MSNSCTVAAKDLRPALERVLSVPTGRTTLPVLHCFKLSATQGILSIEVSNCDVFAISRCACKGDLEPVCISAKHFAFLAFGAPNDIKLTVEAGKLTVEAGGASKLATLAAKQFPDFPKIGTAIGLNASDLAGLIKSVAWATYTGDDRPKLTGVWVKCSAKEMITLGTDGRWLAIQQFPAIAADCEFILPKDSVGIICDALACKDAQMHLSENQVSVVSPDYVVCSKLVEGNYPNAMQVVSDTLGDKIIDLGEFEKASFVDELSKISTLGFADKAGFCACYIEFNPLGAVFDYQSDNSHLGSVSAKSSDFKCRADVNRLLKAMRSVDSPKVKLRSSGSKIVMSSGSYTAICMLLNNDK